MLARGGLHSSNVRTSHQVQKVRFNANSINLQQNALTRRYAADAASGGKSALADAQAIQQKFKAYRDLLSKREAQNQDVTTKIGEAIDSTEEARLAHSWYWQGYTSNSIGAVENDIKKINDYTNQNKEWSSFLRTGSLPMQFVPIEGGNVPAGAKVIKPPADSKVTKAPPVAVLPSTKTPKDLVDELVAATKPSEATRKALYALESKGRLNLLKTMVDYFNKQHTLVTSRGGKGGVTGPVNAELTVAEQWPEAQVNKLLKDFYDKFPGLSAGNVNLTVKVDPSIRGGYKLKIGDRFVDKSEKSTYEKALKAEAEAVTATNQKRQETKAVRSQLPWTGPYSNPVELLEAMQDKYSADIVEQVRGLSPQNFEQAIEEGEKSSLIKSALEFAQPPENLANITRNMIYFKPKDLPHPTVGEVINDFKQVRAAKV